MPSLCWTAVGLHRTGKSGGLAIENDEEGYAPPTAEVADFEVAARGKNNMPAARGGNPVPKIPDAADEIEVLCATKGNLEERQLQTTHFPHTPMR